MTLKELWLKSGKPLPPFKVYFENNIYQPIIINGLRISLHQMIWCRDLKNSEFFSMTNLDHAEKIEELKESDLTYE